MLCVDKTGFLRPIIYCIIDLLGHVLLVYHLYAEILFHFFIASQKPKRDPHHGCRGNLHEER